MTSSEPAVAGFPAEVAGARALVVVAHPDDESFGLGAVLAALSEAGTDVRVLCLTRGEASTLGAGDDLAEVRRSELALAARHLGVHEVFLEDFPTAASPPSRSPQRGGGPPPGRGHRARRLRAGWGHRAPDHRAASTAAERTPARRGLLLMEWGVGPDVAAALRGETGGPFVALDGAGAVDVVVDRARQRAAIACHASQVTGNAVLARRLALQGDWERIRLRRPVAG